MQPTPTRPRKTTETTRSGTWRWYLLLIASITVAFSSGLPSPFYFDDQSSVAANESIRQLTSLGSIANPPANTSVAGRPVVNLSLALNYAMSAFLGVDASSGRGAPSNTVVYHAFNILIHACCALLLFGVVRRACRASGAQIGGVACENFAGLCALLWALHPIQSEPVYYISARTESIASLFILLTLYGSIRSWTAASRAARTAWSLAAVASCALGMASKEIAVTAPVIVLLLDLAFFSRTWNDLRRDRLRLWTYAGLFATELLVLASLVLGTRSRSVGFDLGITWYQYLYTQGWAVPRYLRLLFWPRGLTFDYGEIPVLDWRPIPGFVVLGVFAAATILAWRSPKYRRIAFLGASYFVLLAPSSSIVPIRTEVAAERRAYLASACIVILVVVGAIQLSRRKGFPIARLGILVAVVCATLAFLSFRRGITYLDPVALYSSVIDNAPTNPRGYIGKGISLAARGPDRLAEASSLFRQAMAVDPLNVTAAQSLGWTELARGNPLEAEQSFSRSLRLRPDDPAAMRGIARALMNLGYPDSAAPYASRIGARDTDLLWDLGAQLVQQGRGAAAIPYLETAATTAPHSLGIALFSVALAQSGQYDRAIEAADRAVQTAGDTANVFVLAGRAMMISGRNTEAATYLRRALALNAESRQARSLLDSVNGRGRVR